MTRRRKREGDSLPLTIGVSCAGAALAALFLTTAAFAIRARAFYVGFYGPVWRNYNGDGFAYWDRDPLFYSALISVYSLIGLAGLTFSAVGIRRLVFWRQRTDQLRAKH